MEDKRRVSYMPVARRSYKIDKKPVGTELEFIVDGVLKRKLRAIQKLGQGGIGSVYLAEDVTVVRENEKPIRYALKIVEADTAPLIQEAVQTTRNFGRDCRQIAEIIEMELLILL